MDREIFAQAKHQPRLGGNLRKPFAVRLEQIERPLIVRTGANFAVEARHRFQIMVKHVRRFGSQHIEGDIHTPAKIRHQYFNADVRHQRAGFANTASEMLRPAIFQVIAVNRSDDHIFECHLRDGFCQLARLVIVQRIRAAVGNIAKRATARAYLAHDHKGSGTAAKALAQIRTLGLLAHRGQLVPSQDTFDVGHFRADRHFHPQPVWFGWQFRGWNNLHRNPRHFIGAAQFLTLHNGFGGRAPCCARACWLAGLSHSQPRYCSENRHCTPDSIRHNPACGQKYQPASRQSRQNPGAGRCCWPCRSLPYRYGRRG